MAKKPRNYVQVQAAEFYAKQHGIKTHDAFESAEFQRMWNQFTRNPNNKTIRKSMGLRRRLQKEGEAEENTFCKPAKIRRYTVKIGAFA